MLSSPMFVFSSFHDMSAQPSSPPVTAVNADSNTLKWIKHHRMRFMHQRAVASLGSPDLQLRSQKESRALEITFQLRALSRISSQHKASLPRYKPTVNNGFCGGGGGGMERQWGHRSFGGGGVRETDGEHTRKEMKEGELMMFECALVRDA